MAMVAQDFYTLFDTFLYAPELDKVMAAQWFDENGNDKAVYTIFNNQFEPIYVGSSTDLRIRLSGHRTRSLVFEVLDEVVFVGIKYFDGDIFSFEKGYIRKIEPLLNINRYRI